MGCQSEVRLGDDLLFTINVHDPSTGAAADADSLPTYRVYEFGNDTPLMSGSMVLKDSANTDGFYEQSFTVPTDGTFLRDTAYVIGVAATIGGVTARHSMVFVVKDWWSSGTRTITMTAQAAAAAILGTTIYIKRGDTFVWSFSGVGNISARTKLWFTVKANKKSDEDSESTIQIEETDGLKYLNAADASARSANGSITVTDEVAGSGYVTLVAAETATLVVKTGLYYDLQVLTSIVGTLREGEAAVTADVTRAIS